MLCDLSSLSAFFSPFFLAFKLQNSLIAQKVVCFAENHVMTERAIIVSTYLSADADLCL